MEKDVDKGGMIGYNSQADSEKLWQTKLKSLGLRGTTGARSKTSKKLKKL
ncbi:MAG: hypothetical protein IKK26_05375 [Clostridia bacterium]|nr:hypothetical protein [Clostridia bacterium]